MLTLCEVKATGYLVKSLDVTDVIYGNIDLTSSKATQSSELYETQGQPDRAIDGGLS